MDGKKLPGGTRLYPLNYIKEERRVSMENKIFYEVQQHRQPIIWIIFGIIAAIVILSFLILLILKMDINTLLMFSIAVIVVIGIFLFMHNASRERGQQNR